MTQYEIAGENGHRVRVTADGEQEALEAALDLDADLEQGSITESGGLPIGHDGGDAEDAIAAGESYANGDYA